MKKRSFTNLFRDINVATKKQKVWKSRNTKRVAEITVNKKFKFFFEYFHLRF